MASTNRVLLYAIALFSGSFQQVFGLVADDSDYDAFKSNILYQVQQAEYKLNSSWEIYVNNIQNFSIPEFSVINSTLYGCLENLIKENPTADQTCIGYISLDVQQSISDSRLELEACTNLTYSWNLTGQLIVEANNAVIGLDKTVNLILNKALKCVNIKNPSMKKYCFNNAFNSYSTQFNAGISLAQEAYLQIAGGNLLLGADVSSCKNAENQTFQSKCDAISTEFLGNCLTTTTVQPD